MSTLCFIDNDVILKLAACNLFWEVIAALEITLADLRVLDTARPIFQNAASVQRRYPEAIRNRALLIVQQCQTVSATNDDRFKLLLQIDAIDQGEGTLISALWEETTFWFVTGDKRCLIAIAQEPQCEQVRQKLSGRVVCLEQLILHLLKIHEFMLIRGKVLSAIEYDIALKSCFGSGMQATRENVVSSLEGYIADLRQKSGELLADL